MSDGTNTLRLTESLILKAPDTPPIGDCAAPWVASKAYASVSEKVSYSGYNYRVAHWSQNARPDLNFVETGAAKPWLRLGTCGGGQLVARITGPSSVEAGKGVLLSGVSSSGQGLSFAWAANGFNPSSSPQASSTFIAPTTTGISHKPSARRCKVPGSTSSAFPSARMPHWKSARLCRARSAACI